MEKLNLEKLTINSLKDFPRLFKRGTLTKPLILILDEFDALEQTVIATNNNNNILNLISKAKQEPYKPYVLELFQTEEKIKFIYHDPIINFLYMNGIVSVDQISLEVMYVKFACPYVQKQLFNHFAREFYRQINRLYSPFEDLLDTITENSINI